MDNHATSLIFISTFGGLVKRQGTLKVGIYCIRPSNDTGTAEVGIYCVESRNETGNIRGGILLFWSSHPSN